MVAGGVIVAAFKITPDLFDGKAGGVQHEFGFVAPEEAECKRAGGAPADWPVGSSFFVDEEGLLQLGGPVDACARTILARGRLWTHPSIGRPVR